MSAMDIRLAVGFTDHPKTAKLQRMAGAEAVVCLLRLWLWARVNRPDGILTRMDQDDIEIAAGWAGEPGAFAKAIFAVGFLDHGDGEWAVLHDWDEHQGWACGQKRRSEAARKAALTRWQNHLSADAEAEECGRNAPALNQQCGRNAPSPYPSPNLKQTHSLRAHAREETPSVTFNPHEREPTPDEIRTHGAMVGFPTIDAEAFLEHYRAVGWMRGSTPITDWRPLVSRWRETEKIRQARGGSNGRANGKSGDAGGRARGRRRTDYDEVVEGPYDDGVLPGDVSTE